MEPSTPARAVPASAKPAGGLDAFARPRRGDTPARRPATMSRAPPRVAGIRRLRADDARHIRAGHALGDVCAVAKELLENALDAGASRVEVALRGVGGTDAVVVSDDGRGVQRADFAALCASGATSKRALADLTTFGFRGAALAAVCATCARVVVVTRERGSSTATRLVYDARGDVVAEAPAARPEGTTVAAEQVFENLPVRRLHAQRHAAREVARVVAMVQAYALVAFRTRIELRVSNDAKVRFVPRARHPQSGGVDGDEAQGPVAPGMIELPELRHSIGAVLGRRVLDGLVEFRAEALQEGAELPDEAMSVLAATSVAGFVSSGAGGSAKGAGRGGPGAHQFVYINRRPVDMARLVRAVNECFRRSTGNPGASPVFVLNLSMPPEYVDVNLAPDKRAVMCEQEVAIVAQIVARLEALWAPAQAAHIPTQHLDLKKILRPPGPGRLGNTNSDDAMHAVSEIEEDGVVVSGGGCERAVDAEVADKVAVDENEKGDAIFSDSDDAASSPPLSNRRSLLAKRNMTDIDEVEEVLASPLTVTPRKRPRVTESQLSPASAEKMIMRDEELLEQQSTEAGESPFQNSPPSDAGASGSVRGLGNLDAFSRNSAGGRSIQGRLDLARKFSDKKISSRGDITTFLSNRRTQRAQRIASAAQVGEPSTPSVDSPVKPAPMLPKPPSDVVGAANADVVAVLDKKRERKDDGRPAAGDIEVCVDWEAILGDAANLQHAEPADTAQAPLLNSNAFKHASITAAAPYPAGYESTQEQAAAEVELTRQFRQEWFLQLRVLGQFNLGFIVCQLGRELFIVDQHASDEKRNFEELHLEAGATQRLVRPLALELPAADEVLVVERLADFKAGGYDIAHYPERPPTRRLALRTQAVMRGRAAFVLDDIHEIIAAVRHADMRKGEPLRPPRERALLASRACRKSVMVGDALDAGRMATVVANLARLKHPWTCPHGRPTMRHLCTLDVV